MFSLSKSFNVVTSFTLLAMSTLAKASDERYDASSIGYVLNSGNDTFSTGIAVTSPWFLGSSLAVQAAAMQSWYMHLLDLSLQKLEERLDSNSFIRVHRSAIVQVAAIRTLSKGTEPEVELSSGMKIAVSRRCRGALVERLKYGVK